MTLAVLAILVLGAVTATTWSIFVNRSENAVVRTISKTFPIPAAKLGDRTVLYRDYIDARDTMRIFLASDAAKEQGIAVPFDQTLEQNVLERLLHEQALYEIAEQYEVQVTDAELRSFFSEVTAAATSTAPDISVYLLQTYGWDEETFRQKVLRPALMEQKVSIEVTKQNPASSLPILIVERIAQDDVKRYVRF